MLYTKFTDLELWALWGLAGLRQNAKTQTATDKRSDKTINNRVMHYIGLKGEYAVSRYLDVVFDMEAKPFGDRWGDLIFRHKTIEVKVLQRDLIFNPGAFVSDIAVLVVPYKKSAPDERVKKKAHAFRDVAIAGWVTNERFHKEFKVKDFGYGDRQVLYAHKLNPIDQLKHGSI